MNLWDFCVRYYVYIHNLRFLCLYVQIYGFYLCITVCTYIRITLYTYIHQRFSCVCNVNNHVYIHTHTCIRIFTFVYSHKRCGTKTRFINQCICIYIHTHAYAHIHVYIRTYVYTHLSFAHEGVMTLRMCNERATATHTQTHT